MEECGDWRLGRGVVSSFPTVQAWHRLSGKAFYGILCDFNENEAL